MIDSVQNRNNKVTKVIPTDFDALDLPPTDAQERSGRQIPLFSLESFSNSSYQYQHGLGAGKEGSVDLYKNRESGEAVVVKRYGDSPEISWTQLPSRIDVLSDSIPKQWPNEASAGLVIEAICGTEATRDRIVPLRGMFFGRLDGRQQSPAWHLITPFMPHGSVGKLAKDLRRERGLSIQDLDIQFRPAFEGLLAVLARIHAQGLCHDDVKAGNVLVHDNVTHWSLSDFGQVRGVAHPYHSTWLWIHAQQWTNCKFNDVRRALKMYMDFLRKACDNPDHFDEEFYAGRTAWSRLYWEYFQSPISAQFVMDLSRSHMPGSLPSMLGPAGQPPGRVPLRAMLPKSTVRRLAIDLELSTRLRGSREHRWVKSAFFGWDIEMVAT